MKIKEFTNRYPNCPLCKQDLCINIDTLRCRYDHYCVVPFVGPETLAVYERELYFIRIHTDDFILDYEPHRILIYFNGGGPVAVELKCENFDELDKWMLPDYELKEKVNKLLILI